MLLEVGVGLSLRSADQRDRRTHQSPAKQDRQDAAVPLIHTVRGVGYTLSADRAIARGRGMSGALARWWTSIAFRQALIFGALVVFTMTVLLVVFYAQTVGVWQRRIDGQIDTTTQRLVEYYGKRSGGARGQPHQRICSGDGIDSDTEVYTLRRSAGPRCVGNLALAPDDHRARRRDISSASVLRAGRPPESRLRITRTRRWQRPHRRARHAGPARARGAHSRCESLLARLVTLLMAVGGALLFRAAARASYRHHPRRRLPDRARRPGAAGADLGSKRTNSRA